MPPLKREEVDNMSRLEAEATAEELKMELARRDPWVFITEYCKTDFSKQNEDGTFTATCELIPAYRYLKRVVHYVHHFQKVAIPKSRRMLVTWIVLAYCLWVAMHKKNASIYLQKLKEDDAGFADPNESLCSRIMKIYNRLPDGLRHKKQVRLTKRPPVIYFSQTGSSIMGVAEGPDQLRGKDATIIVIDEAAMLNKNFETYQTIMPIINTGAKIVFISTPNGMEFFWSVCNGTEHKQGLS